MATSNSVAVRDNSTLTNFKQWAQLISNALTAFGWTKSSDTGQVNWGTIASVPTSGNYVYEIWQPGDALTTFYMKVEYGTVSSTTPGMRISIGTATNGAGTLSGFNTSGVFIPVINPGVTSTVTQWNCYFSGDASRFAMIMWRDETNTQGPIFFGVQRSLNSSGAYTSSYITLLCCGQASSNWNWFQQSIMFGVGLGNAVTQASPGGTPIVLKNQSNTTDVFNSQAPLSPVFPDVGSFGNPMDIAQIGSNGDFTEGATYTIAAGNMPYGVSRTYIATKTANSLTSMYSNSGRAALLMRYD